MALRRGMAGYVNGTSNVMHYADGTDNVPGVVPKQSLPPTMIVPSEPSFLQQALQYLHPSPQAVPQVTPEQLQQLPLLPSQQPSEPPAMRMPQGSRTVPRGVVQSPADVSARSSEPAAPAVLPGPVAQDPGASPWGGGGPAFSSEPAVRVPQGSRTVPQGVVQPPVPPTAYSQLMSGHYGEAIQNPAGAPATKAVAEFMNSLGGFGDYLQRAYRAQAVASPPSAVDWVYNTFAGDDASTAKLHEQAAAARQIQDPLTQQYLMAHPGALDEAENDRVAFGAKSQTDAFRQEMQNAVKNHATMSGPVAVGDGTGSTRPVQVANPAAAGKAMTDHGVPADAAVALTHGHQLSREEFINSLINTPTKVIQMLFGAQLGHVPTVHDVIAKTYFDAMGQSLAKERAAIAEMEQRGDKREAADIKKRKAALEANEQLYSTQMGGYVGSYQRQFPMGLPPP